jgi:hypothetical protein
MVGLVSFICKQQRRDSHLMFTLHCFNLIHIIEMSGNTKKVVAMVAKVDDENVVSIAPPAKEDGENTASIAPPGKNAKNRFGSAKEFIRLQKAMAQIRGRNDRVGKRLINAAIDLFTINKGLAQPDRTHNKRPKHLRSKKLSFVEKGIIQDHHLMHAGISIRHGERCCYFGPNDTNKRVKTFHILESPKVQGTLRLLLLIDLVVVCFEIFFLTRALPPSGKPDTDAASLYTPKYGICSQVKNEVEFTQCCEDVGRKYGEFSPFASVDDCKFQHLNASTVHFSSSTSSSGSGSFRRMLLSSSSSHSTGPRCYEHPRRFMPHYSHYPIENILHIAGITICTIFFMEVNLLLWAVTGCRIAQMHRMLCNCSRMIKVGDRVKLKHRVEIETKRNELLKHGVTYCVRHTSSVSGFVDLFEDNANTNILKLVPNVSNKLIELEDKNLCPCPCRWDAAEYALDYFVVSVAFILEFLGLIRTLSNDPEFGGVLFGSLLLLARSWRFVRVAHGVIEARHKYEMAIAEGQEFEHDVRDALDEIDALKTALIKKTLTIEEFSENVNLVFKTFLDEYPEDIEDSSDEDEVEGDDNAEMVKRRVIMKAFEKNHAVHEVSMKYQARHHH